VGWRKGWIEVCVGGEGGESEKGEGTDGGGGLKRRMCERKGEVKEKKKRAGRVASQRGEWG